MSDSRKQFPVFYLVVEAKSVSRARIEAAFCMAASAELDCKEFRDFMWRLSVIKVPAEKEEEFQFAAASTVDADMFGVDPVEYDWDLLDEEAWRRVCAAARDKEEFPENWWERKEYYDSDYTISVPKTGSP